MIRLVTEEEIPPLERFCEGSPFGCKIAGLQRACDLSLPFARFWVQAHEQGEITVAVSPLDGAVILYLESTADRGKLRRFLPATGCRTLPCEESTAHALYGASNRAGEMFACSPAIEQFVTENGVKLLNEAPVRELFSLLHECGEQKAEQFEPFYLDVSRRVHHGACLTQGVIFSDRLAAYTMVGNITKASAVLSAVATHPDFRHRGLDDAVTWALLLCLLSRAVYILCENEQASLFYRSLASSSVGRWVGLDFW